MKNFKNTLIITTSLFFTIVLLSCSKIKNKKEFVFANICCIDTNNVGISNVKYRVYEKKYSYGNPKTVLTGETDQDGKAFFKFNPTIERGKSYHLQVLTTPQLENYDITIQRGNNFMELETSNSLGDDYKFDLNDPNTYTSNDLILIFTPK